MQITAKKASLYIMYTVGYIISFFLAKEKHNYLAGAVLIGVALVLYLITIVQTRNIVNLKGLFALSWVGGQGMACLQLSKLQSDWEIMTWISFFLAFLFFLIGFDIVQIIKKETYDYQSNQGNHEVQQSDSVAKRVFTCITTLAMLSVVSFFVEVIIVGYVPLFSKLPHAYSYFHVSGVHYFTISAILIPGLTVIYNRIVISKKRKERLLLIGFNFIAIAIPILCVSRFQLLFAATFAGVIYILIYKKITVKKLVPLFLLMIPAYVLLTVARNHDVAYLNGIFEMKYAKMPIFITQPYMYVANNYENFNCMVRQITDHSYGLKMLFPVLALTGLKFIFPQLTIFQSFITKKELTTLTVFYDAYYDFGIIGVIILAFLLGYLGYRLTKAVQSCKNPITYLFYGQIAIYFALSFFTTWFSNPTTWFWIALTGMMYFYVGYNKKGKGLEKL